MRLLIGNLISMGFPHLALEFSEQLFKMNGDTIQYEFHKYHCCIVKGDLDKSIEHINACVDLIQKRPSLDSTRHGLYYQKWFIHYYKRDYHRAFQNAQLYEKKLKQYNKPSDGSAAIGSLYSMFGKQEEAEKHLNRCYEECNEILEEQIPWAQNKYVNGLLAAIYSLRKEKEKALEQFAIMASRESVTATVLIQIDCFMFYDYIRPEPEFQRLLSNMKEKHKIERDKINLFLIKEGLDPH